MPVPIGSVEALATKVNHFYPELMATFSDMFNKKRAAPSWVDEWFVKESTVGAYFSAQVWLAPPLPVPFIRGMGLQKAGFGELAYTVYVYDYTTPQMTWHMHDRDDSRAPQDLKVKVTQTAEYLRELPEQVFFELLTEATGTRLHPQVSYANIFGGTGLYDDSRAPQDLKVKVTQTAEYLRELPEQVFFELLTETSGTRLHPQVSYANIFGGTGLYDDSHSYGGQSYDNNLAGTGTSTANITDDMYTLRTWMWDTPNSNGDPYWDPSRVEDINWQFVIPVELEQVFNKLFTQTLSLEGGTVGASSNYIKTLFGDKTKVNVYQRLTDTDDWYARIASESQGSARPFIQVTRKGVTAQNWNEGNSDWTRETLMEAMRWYCRYAFGVGNPFVTAKINN